MTDSAESIVRQHVRWSFGASLIPIPVIDVAAGIGIQLRLISELADAYDVEFEEHRARSVLASLVGSLVPTKLAFGGIGSAVKSIPVVGFFASLATLPVLMAASTHAVGRVFMKHFGDGGSLFDFRPENFRLYLRQQYEEAQSDFKRLKPARDESDAAADPEAEAKAESKPAARKNTKKPAAKKPAAKKNESDKKPAAKADAEKPAAKSAAKKPAAKKAATKESAAKKSASKSSAKKPASKSSAKTRSRKASSKSSAAEKKSEDSRTSAGKADSKDGSTKGETND